MGGGGRGKGEEGVAPPPRFGVEEGDRAAVTSFMNSSTYEMSNMLIFAIQDLKK
jgi:hypothetical protein